MSRPHHQLVSNPEVQDVGNGNTTANEPVTDLDPKGDRIHPFFKLDTVKDTVVNPTIDSEPDNKKASEKGRGRPKKEQTVKKKNSQTSILVGDGFVNHTQESFLGLSNPLRSTLLHDIATPRHTDGPSSTDTFQYTTLNGAQQPIKEKRKRRKTSSGKVTLIDSDNGNTSTIHKIPSTSISTQIDLVSSPPLEAALEEILVPNSSPLPPILLDKTTDHTPQEPVSLPHSSIILASEPNAVCKDRGDSVTSAKNIRPPNLNLIQQPQSIRVNDEGSPPKKRKYTKRKDVRQAEISPQGVVQLQLNPSPTSVRLESRPVILVKKSLFLVLPIQAEKLKSCLLDVEHQKQLRREEAMNKPVHPFFNGKKGQTAKIAGKSDVERDKVDGDKTVSEDNGDRNAFLKFAILGPKAKSNTNPASKKLVAAPAAPWPAQGFVHIRGDSDDLILAMKLRQFRRGDFMLESTKKNKYKPPVITDGESVLTVLSRQQKGASSIYLGKEDTDLEIPPSVRIPNRLEMPASSLLRQHIQPILHARLSSSDIHPALKCIRDKISKCKDLISPFDLGQCETQLWTVKYAPTKAEEVLQPGKEAIYLRDWLGKMKVWAVDNGASSNRSEKRSKGKRDYLKKKKKRKRPEGLDGFLVSEDEEDGTMDEITDLEDEPGMHSNTLKSVIRHGVLASISTSVTDIADGSNDSSMKLMNTVVISGPSGVGKTAAVYAAALEHGFTVFEIHPGMKRGGKEVLEMVGDMSRNHLVHQAKEKEHDALSEKTKPVKSFFKTADTTKSSVKDTKSSSSSSQSNQQQSLILIEEADLLYDDDKQFWTTVLSLITQSRRPVVITCNDETLLPLDLLPLHAIFRFTRPSLDTTVDYLLLLAAAEGHLLQRDPVISLYQDCQGDIRRCIMQLDFWCQMTIGDRTGGMKWWIRRWPPGVDKAEDGQVLRCFSENTLMPGMGSISRDLLYERNVLDMQNQGIIDDEIIWRDVYESTGQDVGDKLFWSMGDLLGGTSKVTNNKDLLASYDHFMDAMSAVDVYAGKEVRDGSPHENFQKWNTILDPTQRPPSLTESNDNVVGLKILRTDPAPIFNTTERSMAMYVRSAAYNYWCKSIHSSSLPHADDVLRSHSSISTMDKLSGFILDRQISRPNKMPSFKTLVSPLEYLSQLDIPFALTASIGHSQVLRPAQTVFTEVAPYVREIARHDIIVEEQLKATSTLLSEGGGGKRKRTTRSAALAAEGRGRGSGRRNAGKYLKGNIIAIAATGESSWAQAVKDYTQILEEDEDEREDEQTESGGDDGEQDGHDQKGDNENEDAFANETINPPDDIDTSPAASTVVRPRQTFQVVV